MQHFKQSLKRLLAINLLVVLLVAGNAAADPFRVARSSSVVLAPIVYPLMDPRVSSSFGNRSHPIFRSIRHHHGIDLAAEAGAPIRSVADGVVVFADPYAGYGNLVVVQHPRGVTTHYGHCQKISVHPGQRVKAGTILGTVGETGITTGPHLHFEIRLNGAPQDPETFIPNFRTAAAG